MKRVRRTVKDGTHLASLKKNHSPIEHRHAKETIFTRSVLTTRNVILSLAASFALWHLALDHLVRSSSSVGFDDPRNASGDATDDVSGSGSGARRGTGGLRSAATSTGANSSSTAAPAEADAGHRDDDFCTLFMAPSTLGPNAGYGIFTAKPFSSGDAIKLNDGPSIPVTDPEQVSGAPHLKVMGDKWWGELRGMPNAMRFEAEDVVEYVAGFGSLPNFHPYLANINPREPMLALNDSVLDRTASPAAGASSIYLGKDILADRDILAGEELFLDYGERFFDENPDLYEDVPREGDYFDASSFLANFYEELGQALEESTAGVATMSISDKQVVEKMLSKMKKSVADVYSTRVASLLPASYADLTKIAEEAAEQADPVGSASGDAPNESRVRFALAREMSTHHVTSPSWLRTHGLCLDNIVSKPSTIPEAGSGGFAARPLKSGEMIVPVPLYHANRGFLATYPIHIDQVTGKFYRNQTRLDGPSQLLINYCFGHGDSSLLLCPITSVMNLNHCSMRRLGGKCGANAKKGPNAKLQWGTKWHPETAQWLQKGVDDIYAEKDRVINLEVVATRDIAKGEEIAIDYGKGWEDAWEEHTQKWAPPADGNGFEMLKSVTRLNKENAKPEPTGDLRNDRSPRGDVMTGCWYRHRKREENGIRCQDGSLEEAKAGGGGGRGEEGGMRRKLVDESKHSSWKDLSDEEISCFASDGSHFRSDEDYTESPNFWPCSVIFEDGNKTSDNGRGGSERNYTVRIFPSKSHSTTTWAKKGEPKLLTNYARSSIRYFHKSYRSDHHLPWAFRHFIELDDALFPEGWKDWKGQGEKNQTAGEAFRIGDRIRIIVSGMANEVGIVMDRSSENGYTIAMTEKGKVRKGVHPEWMKLDVHIEELNIDPFYA